MKISQWGWAALVTVFALSGCSTIRKSSNFEQRSGQIRTVAVIEPSVSIERLVFKGTNEALYDESKKAADALARAIAEQMTKRGYQAQVLQLSEKDLSEDPELKQDVSKLKDRYGTLVADVQKQYVAKMKWKNFKMSLGSDVNPVADRAKADVLIFAAGGGFVKSGGEIANDVAKTLLIGVASLGSVVYVAPSYGGQIFISVVDGDNGDMLWHNFSNPGLQYNMTKEETLERMAQAVLNKYPKRKSSGERTPSVESAPQKLESVPDAVITSAVPAAKAA